MAALADNYEEAVDAIISGDAATLRALLAAGLGYVERERRATGPTTSARPKSRRT